ncbi:hypothetical protein C1645_775949 [Glomus cerebriforme]|uniref:Uncharacterized protein n=1 Tax=Glomus cerebriforme TaxID=658196 RepID=A0A397ST14_9GLOM|nr:hypothetical protein C1645_775949 [Glomus cerebriforme]
MGFSIFFLLGYFVFWYNQIFMFLWVGVVCTTSSLDFFLFLFFCFVLTICEVKIFPLFKK